MVLITLTGFLRLCYGCGLNGLTFTEEVGSSDGMLSVLRGEVKSIYSELDKDCC